jgi:heme A synthase
MVKLVVTLLPDESSDVYVTVVVPTANVAPGACDEVNEATSQLSEDVGASHVTTAEQLPASAVWVMSAGVPAIAGSSSSVTVMSKLVDELLPWMSVAVYVTVVVPTANVAPGACVEVNEATSQLSEDVGASHVTTAEQLPASAVWVMSAGVPAIAGFSSSVTVMVKLVEESLPWMSVAVYVTVVVPTANVSPGACDEVNEATSQLSEDVGASHVTTAEQLPASAV